MKQDIIAEGIKTAPPATVTLLATSNGWSMSDWVSLATILYIALQVGYLAWKWYKEYKASK